MVKLTQMQARRVLLHSQGLGKLPAQITSAQLLHQLGFLQLDSINVVARAQDLTMHSRLPNYRQGDWLTLVRSRQAFEHWTHDAALLPIEFLPLWKLQFARREIRIRQSSWWHQRMGTDPEARVQAVRQRIEAEGPLASRDFETPKSSGLGTGWWNWKPEKAALEYLWQSGQLTVCDRRHFHKVYDLTDRVFPEWSRQPPPSLDETVDWACREALHRLGLATSGELAAFWNLVSPAQASQWCKSHGLPVLDSDGRKSVAVANWEERCGPLPPRTRLLAPFDPIVRDRKRAQRLFDFDFRFEAFVPSAKRVHGYYSLPVLQGERLIGRVTPKLHRREGRLEVQALHWEPGAKPNLVKFEAALARLSAFSIS